MLAGLRALLRRKRPPGAGDAGLVLRWNDEADGRDATGVTACPNCGAVGGKSVMLRMRFPAPDGALRDNRLLRCGDCGCAFYEDRSLPDYADEALLGGGRLPFYLQQGAGIGLLAGVLAQVEAPAGAAYLEIGCGFGFGLDFAVHARGWTGLGVDPGPMAGAGARRLGLTIEQRYLGAEEPALASRIDVAMAAETLEHVPSPLAFLRVLRNVVAPGGVLVLTTPNAECLTRQTASGALVALLSPGHHLVFQSAASLRRILHAAGFTEAVIRADGYGLVAHASDRPLTLAAQDRARAAYLAYLERRAADFPPTDDLRLGYLARLLHEAANDGDAARAGAAYDALRDLCRRRFSLDIETLAALPERLAADPLDEVARRMPLALGGILHADALRRLAQGEARPGLEQRFLCAAEAADALRRALSRLGTDDALSEEIAWHARAEAVLCAIAGGGAEAADRLACLPPPPNGDITRWHGVVQRGFVMLVNAEAYAPARDVAEATGLADWTEAADAADDKTRRDALFCLAVLDVRGEAAAAWPRGARRFARLRGLLAGSADELFWPSVRGEAMGHERAGDQAALAGLLTGLAGRGILLPPDLAERAAMLGVSRNP